MLKVGKKIMRKNLLTFSDHKVGVDFVVQLVRLFNKLKNIRQ